MKSIVMGKYKWYIMAAIVVVLIMSIGLSFCVWDRREKGRVLEAF